MGGATLFLSSLATTTFWEDAYVKFHRYLQVLNDSNFGIYSTTYLPTYFLQIYKSCSSWSLVRYFKTSINFPLQYFTVQCSICLCTFVPKGDDVKLGKHRKCFLPHKLIKTETINWYHWILNSAHNLLTCVTMSAT